jgi:hypothetical protein
VAGVTVVISPGKELKGRIVIDSAAAQPASTPVQMRVLRVRARYRDQKPLGTFLPAANVDDAGNFTITDLAEGAYGFTSVTGLPQDAYLADIIQGAKSALEDGSITVGSDSAEAVQLIYRLGGGSIEGAVQGLQQKSAGSVRIVLVPEHSRRQNPLLYKVVTIDTDGRFVIRGITPGDYKIFPFEELPANAQDSPDFIKKFENSGQPVTVSSGISKNVVVRLIPSSG